MPWSPYVRSGVPHCRRSHLRLAEVPRPLMAVYEQGIVLTTSRCGNQQTRYFGPFRDREQARFWAWAQGRWPRLAADATTHSRWPEGYMWIPLGNPKITQAVDGMHRRTQFPCQAAEKGKCKSPLCQGWWDTKAGRQEKKPWYCTVCKSAQPITLAGYDDPKPVWLCRTCGLASIHSDPW
jgi:hypothetical protein